MLDYQDEIGYRHKLLKRSIDLRRAEIIEASEKLRHELSRLNSIEEDIREEARKAEIDREVTARKRTETKSEITEKLRSWIARVNVEESMVLSVMDGKWQNIESITAALTIRYGSETAEKLHVKLPSMLWSMSEEGYVILQHLSDADGQGSTAHYQPSDSFKNEQLARMNSLRSLRKESNE